MRNRRVVCIDFGSAYTKIAVRRDWGSEAGLLRGAELLGPEQQVAFCIPSVAANRHGKWVFGAAAANARQGRDVEVHQNWKKDLFPKSGPIPHKTRDIAVRFFSALRQAMADHRVDNVAVRVCVPRLNHRAGEQPFPGVLRDAGFATSEVNDIVYEPEANVLGVITRGRNSTHLLHNSRLPYLRTMLDGEGLLAAMRRLKKSFSVLAIDVGAFTTDFGYVRFDTDIEDHKPNVVQESREMGVADLDELIIDGLPAALRQAFRSASTTEREEAKASLYSGGTAQVRNPSGGTTTIGEGQERQMTTSHIRSFASSVVAAAIDFANDNVNEPIGACVFTGGGMQIPAVMAGLHEALPELAPGALLYTLADREVAEQTTSKGSWSGNTWVKDEAEINRYHQRSVDLIRGASAVGGCSVLLELAEAVRNAWAPR